MNLTDVETSLPMTAMIAAFIIFAPFWGLLADEYSFDRRRVQAAATLFWSLATAAAGFAKNFWQLMLCRSLIGIGEAAFATIGPPMIADFFPICQRSFAYMVFNVAACLGGAAGFVMGALLGEYFGWRVSFFACAAPGLLASVLMLLCENPTRGANDKISEDLSKSATIESAQRLRLCGISKACSDMGSLLSNKHYLVCLLGSSANIFALGAFADWYAVFLVRYNDTSVETAGLVLGIATVVGGVGGTFLGHKASDWLATRVKSAEFLVSALFTFPGALCFCVGVNATGFAYLSFILVILGEIFFFTNNAPIQAAAMSVIPVGLRSRSSALMVLCNHLLGDVSSPPIVGAISDASGSLQTALQCGWIMVAVSGLIWLSGYLFLSPLSPARSTEDDPSSGEHQKGRFQVSGMVGSPGSFDSIVDNQIHIESLS